ncbi:MAG: hypothetical protein COB00_08390 [Alcanivorax sp.]|nr:MAG: hypothetical protein COB00_08390 [Alcanivorax sp.]
MPLSTGCGVFSGHPPRCPGGVETLRGECSPHCRSSVECSADDDTACRVLFRAGPWPAFFYDRRPWRSPFGPSRSNVKNCSRQFLTLQGRRGSSVAPNPVNHQQECLKMTDLSRSEEIRFRQEIREFVASEVPESIRLKVAQGRDVSRDETIAWQRKLVARGWGAVHWPKRWGGTDWSLQKRFVFEEEMALAGAPSIPPFNTRMLGPILLEYGTEEQKARFLPGALNMDQWWCQGYSEPSAGSDLAALRTRAVREGDYYVGREAGIKIREQILRSAHRPG